MDYLKLSRFTILLILICFLCGACSSTRKLKKKCHDCPEFSLEKPIQNHPCLIHENI